MKNKSQMEIMGLAILFVLMVFGLLIYLMFSSGEKENPRDEYLQPKMASSVLNSMLKTSVTCDKRGNENPSDDIIYSITDLAKDCVDISLRAISCDDDLVTQVYNSVFYEDQELDFEHTPAESCVIAEYMVRTMLGNSLDKYKIPYYLEVYLKSDENNQGRDIFGGQLSGSQGIQRGAGESIPCKSDMRQREPAVQPFELSTDTLIIQLGICY